MTTRELEKFLRSHKNAPEFGGDYSDARMDLVWNKISAKIGTESSERRPVSLTAKDYVDYFSWRFSSVWLKPMSVGFAAVLLVFGSWVATVNASFDSVPGDVLYPVKLASERAQITLSTSGEQRAKLHAEFAGRRLDEVNAITSSDTEGKDEKVQIAVDGFKKEIASVNDELMNVQTSNPDQAGALAIIVDQKTDEYEATIVQSEPAADALETAQESNALAVSAIVTSNEDNERPQTSESLQKNFQAELASLNARIALSLGRLSVIESVLAKKTLVDPSYAVRIAEARIGANAHAESTQKAMTVLAAGGYRTAFELLAEIGADVAHSEEIITELEIDITTGV
jgi:hypothetical protein